MKILIVSHLWPRADWEHLGIFVADQVAALAAKCNVSVIVPIDRTIRREELTWREVFSGFKKYRFRSDPDLIPVPNIDLIEISYKARLLRNTFAIRTAHQLSKVLKSIDYSKFDFIHAHTVFPDGLACALWLEGKNIPLIVTAHGSDVHSASKGVRKNLGALFEKADLLIPVSRFLGKHLIEFGADPDKIQFLPNGFSGDQFKSIDIKHRDPDKIVFLGRLDEIKRLDVLIRALRFCRPELKLEVAGDGSKRREYQLLTEQLELTDRVKFLGSIRREDVPFFLSDAALMCLVSRREGWPTVIFEALACGTPVLATAVGGIPEALENPELGVIVPEDIEPERLAMDIERALNRDWDYQTIRKHAFNYTWDKLTDRLIEFYKGLS